MRSTFVMSSSLHSSSPILTRSHVASVLEDVLGGANQGESFAGECIGPYRLIEELGEGGFGIVWRAEQLEPIRREVALKLIKPGIDSEEVLARFQREQQVLALLDHPGVSRVFDAGLTQQERPFFVMELVSGVSITRYCRDHELTLQARVELFCLVCAALQHAHEKGVIHRDLKPSNILITEVDGKPQPKIIDFGIAKALSHEGQHHLTWMTREKRLLGTPSYMSPEQTTADGTTDVRTDLYAMGALLYDLLTGSPPFGNDLSLDEKLTHIREVEPVRPSPSCGDLDWICLRCLEKDPARRYLSVDALDADLQNWQLGLAVSAHPPSRSYLLRRWLQRHRAAAALSIMVMLALTTGAGLAFWQAHEANLKLLEAEAVESALIESMLSTSRSQLNHPPQAFDLAKTVLAQIKAGTFPGSPQIQRKILQEAGAAASSASDHTSALWAQEKALSLAESIPGLPFIELCKDRVQTLSQLENLKKHQEAVQRGQPWLTEAKAQLGDRHYRTLQIQCFVADAMRVVGMTGYLELQKDVQEKAHDITDEKVLSELQIRLLQAYYSARLYQEAIDVADKLIPMLRRCHGENHYKVWLVQSLKAYTILQSGKLTEGEALLRSVYERQLNLFGAKHPYTVWTAEKLSRLKLPKKP
jgi:serine/threonine protein kinase